MVVTISGRLSGTAIEELAGLRRSIEGEVTLNLSGLRWANDEGLEAIRAMSLAGDEIRGASPVFELLLQDDPPRLNARSLVRGSPGTASRRSPVLSA